MNCTIVTGGCLIDASFLLKYIKKSDFIIGVDKGIDQLLNMSKKIDIAIGDFDSISNNKRLNSKFIKKIVTLNPVKDESDTHAAVDIALSKGAKEIVILSGIGNRMDHTLSTISLLEKINSIGVEGFVVDKHNRIRYANKVNLILKEYDYFSLIPLENKVIVTTEGFKYEAEKLQLNFSQSRFLSNELIGEKGTIKVKGRALIIESRD
ncbi:MAG: thiamine diphosphokinase [Lagierella massiliensis]|nr:thiamine diphosphokinase [Lagierella massiliensis]